MNGLTIKFVNGKVELATQNGDISESVKSEKLYEIEFDINSSEC